MLVATLLNQSFQNLKTTLEILDWFVRNSMVANPRKLQFMFLGLKETENLGLNINCQIIRASEKVELLGVTIDKKLTTGQHVEDFCMNVNTKVKASIDCQTVLILIKQ